MIFFFPDALEHYLTVPTLNTATSVLASYQNSMLASNKNRELTF